MLALNIFLYCCCFVATLWFFNRRPSERQPRKAVHVNHSYEYNIVTEKNDHSGEDDDSGEGDDNDDTSEGDENEDTGEGDENDTNGESNKTNSEGDIVSDSKNKEDSSDETPEPVLVADFDKASSDNTTLEDHSTKEEVGLDDTETPHFTKTPNTPVFGAQRIAFLDDVFVDGRFSLAPGNVVFAPEVAK